MEDKVYYLEMHKVHFYCEISFYNFVIATQTPSNSIVRIEGIDEPTTVWDVLATPEQKAKYKFTA